MGHGRESSVVGTTTTRMCTVAATNTGILWQYRYVSYTGTLADIYPCK